MNKGPELSDFIGRAHEVQLLRRRLQDLLQSGRGRVVLVGGEPGIGKTALVDHVFGASEPAACVTVYCLEDVPTPYGPWRDAVAGLVDPEILTVQDPGHSRLHPSVVAARLLDVTERRPVPTVLVLEDLQWADAATLDVLRLVTARIARAPLLVVATYRTDELHAEHVLWHLLPGLQRLGADRLVLPRLTRQDTQSLVQHWLADEELARRAGPQIVLRSQGVPLFAKELARQVIREGFAAPSDLPDTLRQAIDARLAHLPDATRPLIEAAAVLGEQSGLWLLAAMLGEAPEDVADGVADPALRRVLVLGSPGMPVRFEHSLVREAVLANMLPSRRTHWHRKAAEILQSESPERQAAVAYHLAAAGDPRASAALLQAGTLAFRQGAFRQATAQWEAAEAACNGDDPLLAEILLKRGVALRWSEAEESDRLLADARRRAEAAEQGAVALWARHHMALRIRQSDVRALMPVMATLLADEEALLGDAEYRRLETDLFGDNAPWPRILPPYVECLATAGHTDRARALLSSVPPDAAAPGGSDVVQAQLGLAFLEGFYGDATTWASRAAEGTRRVADWRSAILFKSYEALFTALTAPHDHTTVDGLVATLKEWEQEAERLGGERPVDDPYSLSGIAQYLFGQWKEAAVNLVGCSTHRSASTPTVVLLLAADLLLDKGDRRQAARLAARLLPLRPEDPIPPGVVEILTYGLKARVALAGGDPTAAGAWLSAGRRHPNSGKVMIKADLDMTGALLAEAEGRLEDARAMAEQARRIADAVPLWWHAVRAGRVEVRCLAGLGHLNEARRLGDALREQCQTARYKGLEALLAMDRSAWEDGAETRAEAARDAARLFQYMGVPSLAAAMLARAKEPASTGDNVTAREREIARMVAEGLTDREIAAHLRVSRRTVDRHLRNVFDKVGVANRAALAAYAVRHGWL